MAQAKRRRLSAADARARILDAAERKLIEAGPEALRLAELAEELGISHPAILHHFGSRDELVREVVKRAISTLNAELIAAFMGALTEPDAAEPEQLMQRIARTLEGRGQARLIAWMTLSGREAAALDESLTLSRVAEAAHAFRKLKFKDKKADPRDTEFLVQLVAFALLGEAVFGERLRRLEGFSSHPRASADFRSRLGKLLAGEVEASESTGASAKKSARPTRGT